MEWLTGILVVLGGLNFGMAGFFNYDVLDHWLTAGTGPYRVITAIIGVAALYVIGAVLYRVTEPQSQHAHV